MCFVIEYWHGYMLTVLGASMGYIDSDERGTIKFSLDINDKTDDTFMGLLAYLPRFIDNHKPFPADLGREVSVHSSFKFQSFLRNIETVSETSILNGTADTIPLS